MDKTVGRSNNGKRISLELIRIIAIALVIFNHTGAYGFEIFMKTDSFLLRGLSVFLDLFCKAGVPLFFMISGATLLSKDEEIKDIFVKRVLKIGVVLLVFSFIYYLRLYLQHPEYGFSIGYFIKYIYAHPIVTPFWFLYLYIGFLLMLPFIRAIARNIDEKTYKYLIVLTVVFSYLVFAEKIAGFERINIALEITGTVFFYPLAGFYFTNIYDFSNTKRTGLISIIAVAVNYVLCMFLILVDIKRGAELSDGYVSQFAVIPTLAIFALTISLYEKKMHNKTFDSVIAYIGNCTFCTYLFEEMLRIDVFMKMMEKMAPVVPGLVMCIPYIIFMIGSGVIISTVIKRIPFINKLGL